MKWNSSKYIIKRWLCRSERSTIYGFVNKVYTYFCRLYFALLIWLSCNYQRKIKSQPETSLHTLVFMSRGQETLASGSVRWHEQAYEFSQTVWSLLLYLSVDWLVKSHIFIPASQMLLQFNSTYQPHIIFRCCWRLIQFLSKFLYQECPDYNGNWVETTVLCEVRAEAEKTIFRRFRKIAKGDC